jgi:glutamine amidotransferase
MIVIIDYQMGNLGSIQNMLKKIGHDSIISSKKEDIIHAGGIILPGVGAFDTGMQNLSKYNVIKLLDEAAHEKKIPLLGICLGMQLLTKSSEEGKLPGLGFVSAETKKFTFNKENNHLKIPHMGWNTITIKKQNPLTENLGDSSRFYFVHSYYVACKNPEDILTETEYGFNFCSSFQHENIFGVQFHPEKSHRYGMQLLKNFTLFIK